MALPAPLLLTPADSARVVGEVYGLSLLATIVLVATALALLGMRRASAGARALACRSAVVALLAVAAGRLLPVRPMLWVVPEGMATPLIALGKAQLGAGATDARGIGRADGGGAAVTTPVVRDGASAWLAPTVFVVYAGGVLFVLLTTARARWRLRRLCAEGTRHEAPPWKAMVREAAKVAGLRDADAARVQLFTSRAVGIPTTWGGRRRPVIVLPHGALAWSETHQRLTLVHELSHVRFGDAHMALAARIACALFWFHPGVWWLAERLSAESELACDDRVLIGGVRRSDYAELLAVAERHASGADAAVPQLGMALLARGGVRQRLAAIVDTTRPLRAPSREAIVLAMLGSALLAVPLGTVQIAPTRAVLATLLHDVAWESRAYAAVRLAQRADSVEMARTAARLDPSPAVRAWARFAVDQADARARADRRPALQPDRRGTRSAPATFLH
jgi:beta-lactamase regulating signal transducer with metallopeptidase domain